MSLKIHIALCIIFLTLGIPSAFSQPTTKLDIIWVVDNSGSMDDYHHKLLATVDGFFQQLKDGATHHLDIKMGLLSTSVSDHPLMGFRPPNPVEYPNATHLKGLPLFKLALKQLGAMGDSFEKAFIPVQKALYYFPDFLRPKSKLILIIVSNEEESGSRPSIGQFIDLLYSHRKYDSVSTYGLFGIKENGCAHAGNDEFAGSRYDILVKATGGKAFPICHRFEDSLTEMAIDMVVASNFLCPRVAS